MHAAAPEPPNNPTGLLAQWRLLCSVIDAPWSTALDHRVARHVIQRYVPKFGQARVSSRYLVQATGARRQNVIDSLRRLAAQGAIISARPGVGTRPTEYALNFAFSVSGPAGEATDDNLSSGPVDETTGGPARETTTAASGPVHGTESCLPEPAYKPAYGISRDTVPALPPAVAADAASAAAGRLGFDDFWTPYPRKFQRAKAKAVWEKLSPDDVLSAAIVEGARIYGAYCREIGKDAQYIKQPENWLAGECWLEDPTAGFAPKLTTPRAERQPKIAGKTKASNDGKTGPIKGGVTDMPRGSHLVEIVEFEDIGSFGAHATLQLREVDGPGEWTHRAVFVSDDEPEWQAGRASLNTLRTATGGGTTPGRFVWASVTDVIEYRAAIAPKSAQGATAAR